jgi:hypothetical protein
MRNLVTGWVLLFVPLAVQAVVIDVPDDQPTIQAGINAASSGDTIRVSAGTYNLNSPLEVSNKVITLESASGKSSTFIVGGGVVTLLIIQNVGFPGVHVDGFTFRDGQATQGFHGGCAVIQDSVTSIVNSHFQNCKSDPDNAANSGGAIKVSNGSSVSISDSEFTGNRSYSQGGAVHILGATGSITGNHFQNNISKGGSISSGGAVKVTDAIGAAVEIHNNQFEQNQASFAGGAISVFKGDSNISNNVFVGNGNGRFAGAIHFETPGETYHLTVSNNVFDNNFVLNINDPKLTSNFDNVSGAAMHINLGDSLDSSVEIHENQFSGNSATDSRCGTTGDCGRGGGFELIRGFGTLHTVRDNSFLANEADIYPVANFDKSWVEFSNNQMIGNRANHSHVALGCVSDSFDKSAICHINANLFEDNAYTGAVGAGSGNDSGSLNIRRMAAIVTNNIFVSNVGTHAIVFFDSFQSNSEGIDPRVPMSLTVAHNTFVDSAINNTPGAVVRVRGDDHISSPAVVSNNIIDSAPRALRLDDVQIWAGSAVEGNDIINMNIDVARIDSTTGISSMEELNAFDFASANVAMNPEFVDRVSNNFRLQEVSPLIDLVSCVGGIDEDFDGNVRPFGEKCDIGAFEFVVDFTIFHDRFESN